MDSVLINNLNLASSHCQCDGLKARRQKKNEHPRGWHAVALWVYFCLSESVATVLMTPAFGMCSRECAVARVLPEKSLLWSQLLSVLLDSLTLLLRSVSTPPLGPHLTSPSPTPLSQFLSAAPLLSGSPAWSPGPTHSTASLCHPT